MSLPWHDPWFVTGVVWLVLLIIVGVLFTVCDL